ncbi:MAG: hypothetical protein STSR0008_10660 [Ignavibacterium sp.]
MDKEMKIYGVTGLFNTPDEIIKAAKETSNIYKKFDVNTPYPVHGMDNAMKLKPSKLGFITLGFGLTGAAVALLFMYWSMSISYPMIIGGKPFFALPAFIPITFELTVLFATLATIIGMLTFFFNFPFNKHPLHDTDYLKNTSNDKYGICIEAEDEKFNESEVVKFLENLGANKIETVYYKEENIPTVFTTKFITFLIIVFILVSGGTYFTLNKLLYMVPFDWMVLQDRVNVQSASTFFKDSFGMRMPVKGTVSREYIPYVYAGQMQQPENPLVNPMPSTKEVLELGKKKFNTFCSPCHGNFGDGDSRLRGQFPNPPSLHSTKVREWKDGNIYHVITNGQNVMPSYASQLSSDERWAIINYIRALQRAKNASESDIQLVQKGTAK